MVNTVRDSQWSPEIQALRAVSVALVVAFHIWPKSVVGGFVGVDAFFVISGYLITAHLLREVEREGNVNLRRFWARRVRRLLPSAVLVLVVSAIAILLLAPKSVVAEILLEIGAAAAYCVNWVLAFNAVDYFGAETGASPVQHYWSLSVEEQFYIVWPVLIVIAVLASRSRPVLRTRLIVGLMVVLAVAGFALSVGGALVAPEFAYFATTSHVWEFAIGGLLAVAVARGLPEPPSVLLRSALMVVGFTALISAGLLIRPEWGFPGWVAIWPVAGVVCVIAAGRTTARPFAMVVESRPVQWLGTVSYSLYLWHWPVIVVMGYLRPAGGRVATAVIIVGSLLLAWLTTRFVESPVRTAPSLVRSPLRSLALGAALTVPVIVFTFVAAGLISSGESSEIEAAHGEAEQSVKEPDSCFGAMAIENKCSPWSGSGTVQPAFSAAAKDRGEVRGDCWSMAGGTKVNQCEFGSKEAGAPRIAIVGDSHAGQYADPVIALARLHGWHVTVFLKVSCIWRSDSGQATALLPPADNCAAWNRSVDTAIRRDKPDLIVTSGYAKNFKFEKLPTELRDRAISEASDSLSDQWAEFIDVGVPIVAIVDGPVWPAPPVDCLSAASADSVCELEVKDAFPYPDPQAAATESSGAHVLDLTQYFCFDGYCPPVIGDVVVYRDKHHLTSTYAISLANLMDPMLEEALEKR